MITNSCTHVLYLLPMALVEAWEFVRPVVSSQEGVILGTTFCYLFMNLAGKFIVVVITSSYYVYVIIPTTASTVAFSSECIWTQSNDCCWLYIIRDTIKS